MLNIFAAKERSRRRTNRQLAELDDHLLRDIGMDRGAVGYSREYMQSVTALLVR